MDRLIHADRPLVHGSCAVVLKCLHASFTRRCAECEAREHLEETIDSNPNVLRPRNDSGVGETGIAKFGLE